MEVAKKLPKFNSIEEVKEFISDPANGGVVQLVGENTSTMTMNEFIEKVGIDNAAKFIYDNSEKAMAFTATGEEIEELIKKFENDPNSLTKEEKILLAMAIKNKMKSFSEISRGALTLITKTFLELSKDDKRILEFRGMLSILITFMEGTFSLSSDKISVHCGNPTYTEMIKCVEEQITIPEDIDKEILFITLLNIIGKRFIEDKNINPTLDLYKFSECLELDTKFLFEETVEE